MVLFFYFVRAAADSNDKENIFSQSESEDEAPPSISQQRGCDSDSDSDDDLEDRVPLATLLKKNFKKKTSRVTMSPAKPAPNKRRLRKFSSKPPEECKDSAVMLKPTRKSTATTLRKSSSGATGRTTTRKASATATKKKAPPPTAATATKKPTATATKKAPPATATTATTTATKIALPFDLTVPPLPPGVSPAPTATSTKKALPTVNGGPVSPAAAAFLTKKIMANPYAKKPSTLPGGIQPPTYTLLGVPSLQQQQVSTTALVPQQHQVSSSLAQVLPTLAAKDDTTLLVEMFEPKLTEDLESQAFASWARVAPNLYNTAEQTAAIKASKGTTKEYTGQKRRTVTRFFNILSAHKEPRIQALATLVHCPSTGADVYKLVTIVRGVRTPAKKCIVNTVVVIFCLNLRMIGEDGNTMVDVTGMSKEEIAQLKYQPSSLLTRLKHLFSWFTEQEIMFNQSDFKNYQGSFHAYLKDDFAETLTVRDDFGKRKSAPTDLMADAKLRDPANGLQPFRRDMFDASKSGLTDLQRILAHQTGSMNALRSHKEPAGLRKNSFIIGTQHGGPKHGLRFVKLGTLDGRDKTQKLSLAHPYTIESGNTLVIWQGSDQDRFEYTRMIHYYIQTQLQPACDEAGVDDCDFFLRRAPEKVMKKRRALGLTHEVYIHKNAKWSGDYLNQQVRALAIQCKFHDSDRWTMRSGRRQNITRMVAGNVPDGLILQSGRHKSVATSALYQDPSLQALAHRSDVLQYDPVRDGVQLDGVLLDPTKVADEQFAMPKDDPATDVLTVADTDDDNDKKPAAKPPKSKKKKSRAPDTTDEDSEATPAPKPKSKKKSRRRQVPDTTDEDSDAPKSRKSRKRGKSRSKSKKSRSASQSFQHPMAPPAWNPYAMMGQAPTAAMPWGMGMGMPPSAHMGMGMPPSAMYNPMAAMGNPMGFYDPYQGMPPPPQRGSAYHRVERPTSSSAASTSGESSI